MQLLSSQGSTVHGSTVEKANSVQGSGLGKK
jgi:hypothetical protein